MLKAIVTSSGTISLPKSIGGRFSPDESLFVEANKNSVLLKKAKIFTLLEVLKLLKPLGGEITPEEVTDEIVAYRTQK